MVERNCLSEASDSPSCVLRFVEPRALTRKLLSSHSPPRAPSRSGALRCRRMRPAAWPLIAIGDGNVVAQAVLARVELGDRTVELP